MKRWRIVALCTLACLAFSLLLSSCQSEPEMEYEGEGEYPYRGTLVHLDDTYATVALTMDISAPHHNIDLAEGDEITFPLSELESPWDAEEKQVQVGDTVSGILLSPKTTGADKIIVVTLNKDTTSTS